MEHSQVHREHGQIFFSSIWWAHKLLLAHDHSFPLDKLLVLWPKEVICWNFLHRSNFYFSYENSTYKKQNISLLFEIISCTSLFPHISFTEHCLTSEVPNNWLQSWKTCFYNQHSLDSKYSGDSNHQGIHEQLPGKDVPWYMYHFYKSTVCCYYCALLQWCHGQNCFSHCPEISFCLEE